MDRVVTTDVAEPSALNTATWTSPQRTKAIVIGAPMVFFAFPKAEEGELAGQSAAEVEATSRVPV